MTGQSQSVLALARNASDPHLAALRHACSDVKVFYCPSPLFETYPAGCLDELGRLVLVADTMLAGPAGQAASRVWPLSRWQDALNGADAPPAAPASPETPQPVDAHAVPGQALFVPLNETHVKMLHPVAQLIPNRQFLVFNDDEHAEEYLKTVGETCINLGMTTDPGVSSVPGPLRVLGRMLGPLKAKARDLLLKKKPASLGVLAHLENRPSVVVLGNDWAFNARCLIEEAREIGIPTVCIQEGPQDFDLDIGPLHHARHILLQGAVHGMYMRRGEFLVTGNPRLEALNALPLPEPPKVMVNANFTYNVFEDARDAWMGGVAEACGRAGVEYFVSKHPRDSGDYSGYPVLESNAFKIEEQINMATVLVSRFSQVVYECALRGRRVVYYNPHGEVKKVLTGDRSGAIYHAANPAELADCLRKAVAPDPDRDAIMRDFLTLHCGPRDEHGALRCVQAIAAAARGDV
jgi:hypothetical protein